MLQFFFILKNILLLLENFANYLNLFPFRREMLQFFVILKIFCCFWKNVLNISNLFPFSPRNVTVFFINFSYRVSGLDRRMVGGDGDGRGGDLCQAGIRRRRRLARVRTTRRVRALPLLLLHVRSLPTSTAGSRAVQVRLLRTRLDNENSAKF